MKKLFPVVLVLLVAVFLFAGCTQPGRGRKVPDAGQPTGQQSDVSTPDYGNVDDILNLLDDLNDLESEIDDVDEGDLYIP